MKKTRMTKYKSILLTIALATLCNATVDAQDDLLEQEEKALQAAVTKASPSVVQLELIGGLESQ